MSVIKLGRHAAMHSPKIIIGEGQGALVAIGYGQPGVLETAMASRNVQRAEAQEMAEAWGNVACILAVSPRMSKSNFGLDRLRTGVPELFQKDCPAEAVKTYGVKVPKAPHFKE